jgi:2-polyprenyl-3-methyl-5-hydroxy-6-metoxy-1,4-benzoquinol methylase
MMGGFFTNSGFSTSPARLERFSSALADNRAPDAPLRILDVGCGSGEQLLTLASHFPQSEVMGIDISSTNIEMATLTAARLGVARAQFVLADILTWQAEPFDVIISDSVMQNIPDGPALIRQLARLLRPGGLLMTAVPYDGLYNRLLWGGRRVARLFAGPMLEKLLLKVARRLHPDWDEALLRQRLGYMYMLPYLRDGAAFRILAKRNDLRLIDARALPHASLAQPMHRLLVFTRETP